MQNFTRFITLGLMLIAAGATPAFAQHSEHEMMMHSALPPATGPFQRAFPVSDPADQERFDRGRNVLNKVWSVAPSDDTLHDGLGPLFNQRSCIACHTANGRGHVPDDPSSPMISALVRLSVRDHGRTVPHPAYGVQLNEQGIAGVAGEGRAEVRYTPRSIKLGAHSVVHLRQPHIVFRDLHYGPIDRSVMTSLRIAPPLVGLGLLGLVSEATLLEYADPEDADHDGISGRPNLVHDERRGDMAIGRFGWKASSPDLFTQSASAFREDMGLTNTLFPESSCTSLQLACLQAPSGGDPEVADFMLENITVYLEHGAPPERRHAADPETLQGETLFRATGCAACHRETLVTGESARLPALSHFQFNPYTDLLLHDMGDGLSDSRPDGQASGREWRTAPLWGVGLAQAADPDARFLHDGRARTITEAILWHDGEAHVARERFRSLTDAQRSALLTFLDSL